MFLFDLLAISFFASILVLAVKGMSKVINRTFDAKWKYWFWIALAIRLIVPFTFSIPSAPLQIPLYDNSPAVVEATSNEMNTYVGTDSRGDSKQDTKAEHDKLDVLPYVLKYGMPLWLLGACLLLARQLIGYAVEVHAIHRWLVPVKDARILRIVSEQKADLHAKTSFVVAECREISSPMVIGFFKHTLLLPHGTRSRTDEELTYAIRHELIHLKRHDLWYKLLITAANSFHWFNPIMYLMFREASADLEISCDALTIEQSSDEIREAYGRTIITFLPERTHAIKLSTHFTGGVTTMKNRLENIIVPSKNKKGVSLFIACILAIAMMGSLVTAVAADTTGESPIDTRTAGADKEDAIADSNANAIFSAFFHDLVLKYGTMETWPYEIQAEMSAKKQELGLVRDDYVIFGLPDDHDISEEEAISIANAILEESFAVTEDMLDLYYVNTSFIVREPNYKQWDKLWKVSYNPAEGQKVADIGYFSITIDGISGEIISVATEEDAVG